MLPRQLYLVLVPLVFLNLTLAFGLNRSKNVLADISSQAPDVTISASVDYCPYVIITPQNRIPPTNNNSLEINVGIRDVGSALDLWTTTVTTDNTGTASLCPIGASTLPNTNYDVAIKGLSHLRRLFSNLNLHNGNTYVLDLRSPVLFAGDSHPTADNYVNSLDVSYEILNLYTSDLRADLNRDSIVNSLEFPTLISNLYSYGDN